MVYLETSEEWQRQTTLLLQARPTSTRITTKYNIPNLASPKYQQKLKKRKREGEEDAGKNQETRTLAPRAKLTLKTYDPASGVTLKFKTDRAAEVGRLINGLGRVGRHMAALPEKHEAHDTGMEDAGTAPEPTAEPTKEPATAPQTGGGAKKKKKNKK